jgi:hypothetical protein
MFEDFRGLRKFPDCYFSWMQYMTKDIFTTKVAKDTKTG